MNIAERRLIAYVAAAHGLTHVIELAYPLLLTRIALDFGRDDNSAVWGAIAWVFGLAFGSSAIPAGFLTDRIGTRRVLVYAFASTSVMATLAGLAPNEWLLTAALAGLGLTIGLYHPAGLSAMAQGVRQRGLALGFHGAAGNLGQAAAPAIVAGLAIAVDWRLAFFSVGGLAAVLTVVLATAHLPVHGDSEVLAPAESFPAPEDGKAAAANNLFLPLLLVYAAFVLSGIVYRGAITYLPKHFEEAVDADFGAALVAAPLAMGAVGQLVGGSISQRIRLETMAPIIGLLTIPALALTAAVSGWALLPVASLFIFLYFANQPVFTGLIADYAPAGTVGRSYGVSFFAGFGLGATGGVIAGAFVDIWNTGAAFLGLSTFMGVTLILSFALLFLAEQRRRQPAPQAVEGRT